MNDSYRRFRRTDAFREVTALRDKKEKLQKRLKQIKKEKERKKRRKKGKKRKKRSDVSDEVIRVKYSDDHELLIQNDPSGNEYDESTFDDEYNESGDSSDDDQVENRVIGNLFEEKAEKQKAADENGRGKQSAETRTESSLRV